MKQLSSVLWSTLFHVLLIFGWDEVSGKKWQDKDTIVIEADSGKSRNERQFFHMLETYFSFPPLDPYTGIYGNEYDSYGIHSNYNNNYQNMQRGSCYTTNMEVGVCAPLSECYPVLYTMDSYNGERNITNSPLAEDLLRSSGPCSNNPEDYRNNIICCPTLRKPRYPQWTPSPTANAVVPTPPNCGHTKVVHGKEAKKGSYPWMVALMNRGRQFCGGSLIDDYHVITAAHCVSHMSGADVQNLRLYIGAHDLYSALERERISVGVSSVRYHRGFTHRTLLNDIAIMKLNQPVRYWNYNNINAICLSSGNPRYDVGWPWVKLAGWGKLHAGGPQPSRLQDVDVQVWPQDTCRRKLGNIPPAGLQDHMVCASANGGKDACQGDSGGPLMRWLNKRVEQIGIVSWGVDCGRFPGSIPEWTILFHG